LPSETAASSHQSSVTLTEVVFMSPEMFSQLPMLDGKLPMSGLETYRRKAGIDVPVGWIHEETPDIQTTRS
jgi:hypothetical protein